MMIWNFIISKFKYVNNWIKSGFIKLCQDDLLNFIYKITNTKDDQEAINKLITNHTLLKELSEKMENLEYIRHFTNDLANARERDLHIRIFGTNHRANSLVLFSLIGFVLAIFLTLYSTDPKKTLIAFIFAIIFGNFTKSIFVFEFGMNYERDKITLLLIKNLF